MKNKHDHVRRTARGLLTPGVARKSTDFTPVRAPVPARIVLPFLLLLVQVSPALGQAASPAPRPKIGVALAGGSALGLAHVGALQWLEEHHIPIDYIAGTSMGGLMGGTYATGLSPAEMHAMLKAINWRDMLAAQTPYQDLDFRRKQDFRAVPGLLELGVRHGPSLPLGVSAAHPVDLLISRICMRYSALNSFDDLPTPFRCVATDMATGEAYTLKDGPLATALRATMSIPAVFTPVKRNGRLLTDGGTVNNLPTEALKAMGADIIIAVNLHSMLQDVKELRSLIDVLGQTAAIAIKANETRSLALADIVLTPDLDGLTGQDFDKVDQFAPVGYQAAAARAAVLSRLALPPAEWEAYLAQRRAKIPAGSVIPQSVRIENAKPKEAEALAQRLKPLVGVPLEPGRIDDKLTRLTGSGRYDSFMYWTEQEGGRPALVVEPNHPHNAPPFLRLGMSVNGAEPDNILFNFAARLIALDVGAPGAEVRGDLRLGSDNLISGEYYRPFGLSRLFVAPRFFYEEHRQNLWQGSDRLAVYRSETPVAELDLGYDVGRASELRLGYQIGHLNTKVSTGPPILPTESGTVSTAILRFQYEGYDTPWVPSRGTRVAILSNAYFEAPRVSGTLPRIDARATHFQPVSRRGSLYGLLDYGTTFGSTAPPAQQFTLGGPLRLSAYGLDRYRGSHYLLSSLGYLHQVFELPPMLGHRVDLGVWYEAGYVTGALGSDGYKQDVAIGLIADTVLGPFLIGGSFGESGESAFYFTLGNVF
jgi:NTE family protein